MIVTEKPVQVRRTPPLETARALRRAGPVAGRVHVRWIGAGFALAFLIPFIFADLANTPRDAYYAVYACVVGAFLALWVRNTRQDVRALVSRRPLVTAALAVICGALLVATVLKGAATPHPSGWKFVGAIFWRGAVYGAADGLFLSSFPILATFATFAARPLRERTRCAVVGIGALALAMSLAFTAVYHVGYPDFRGSKMRKPIAGDVIWSTPTLVTLNPIGAPIAHVALHVAAATHSYDTNTFLPPHQ
jgi:hypothetical protein